MNEIIHQSNIYLMLSLLNLSDQIIELSRVSIIFPFMEVKGNISDMHVARNRV